MGLNNENDNPASSLAVIENIASEMQIPLRSAPVYHRIKFWNEAVYGNITLDSIHTQASRFDTALVQVYNYQGDTPIIGQCGRELKGMFLTIYCLLRILSAHYTYWACEYTLFSHYQTMSSVYFPPTSLLLTTWHMSFALYKFSGAQLKDVQSPAFTNRRGQTCVCCTVERHQT